MKKTLLSILLSMPVVTIIALPGYVTATEEQSKQVDFALAVGVEGMTGDTTYQIGGNVMYGDGSTDGLHFPVNELEWPLDIWLGRIDAGISLGDSWRIQGTVKLDMSDPDDRMIYKDWITFSNPAQLDIYSESNIADFDATIVDIAVEWIFLQRETWSVYTGLGYQYQDLEYQAAPIYQFSPSGMPGVEHSGDGSIGMTYQLTNSMPYAEIGSSVTFADRFALTGSFSYAPWVSTEDDVVHVYRNLDSSGDLEGYAIMLEVVARYTCTSGWFVDAGLAYTMIDVDGTSNFLRDGAPLVRSIEQELESSQTSGYLKVGYTF